METPEPIIPFAATRFRNQYRKFGIKIDDRRRHMYLVGKTGMGKSTLLENMIIGDMRAGNGLAVVDPHGDLAEKILDFVPNNRVNDVIYFNPSDTKHPVAFNILESVGEEYKHLIAYGLVGVFKKIWADSWGPRMEYIMTNTILALLDYPGSTLLGLMRMLVDKAYRKKVVAKVTDPVVKTFWTDEFANYSEKFRTEAIAPIQNKVGQFLSSSIIRNIVGQSKSTIEMREIMDNKKILIMNLAKGRVGEENSALLGAMMITRLQIAAMSRVDIPEEQRNDFYLYVDEFQNFATDSFASILSEARKYRLCLIMAHQYLEQLGDVVKPAVFGNVGTMIVFRIGAADALELEPEFTPQFLAQDIVNLPKYAFCLRLMIDGIATDPFSAIGLPPAGGRTNNGEKVIKVSRERYARPQDQVEDKIIRWSGVEISRPAMGAAENTEETDMVDATDEQDGGNEKIEDAPESESAENTTPTQSSASRSQSESMLGGAQLSATGAIPGVNLASFIPGLQATTSKSTAQPTARVDITQASLDDQPLPAPKINLAPVEVDTPPAVQPSEAQVEPRAKINFVKQITPTSRLAQESEKPFTDAPNTVTPKSNVKPAPKVSVSTTNNRGENVPNRALSQESFPKKPAPLPEKKFEKNNLPVNKPNQVSPKKFLPPQNTNQVKPKPTQAGTKPLPAPSLSLASLKGDNVPKVMFNKKREQTANAQSARPPIQKNILPKPSSNTNTVNNSTPSKSVSSSDQVGSKINIKDLL